MTKRNKKLTFLAIFLFLISAVVTHAEDEDLETIWGLTRRWRQMVVDNSVAKPVILLEMLEKAAQNDMPHSFLFTEAPLILFGATPKNQEAFQALLLQTLKNYDLARLRKAFKIPEARSDLFITSVLEVIFYLYAPEDKRFLNDFRQLIEPMKEWPWIAGVEEPKNIESMLGSIREHIGPTIGYHVRAKVKKRYFIPEVSQATLIVEWELVKVKTEYDFRVDKMMTSEESQKPTYVVRIDTGLDEGKKIAPVYGTKEPLTFPDFKEAEAFFNSVQKNEIEKGPKEIADHNWGIYDANRANAASGPLLFTKKFGDRELWAVAEFVPIPAGKFMMGSCHSEYKDFDELPRHHVTLTKDFEIQATEVTQLQWFLIMGTNPSHFKEKKYCEAEGEWDEINGVSLCMNYPVENVNWRNIQGFITELNNLTNTGYFYRLPTEAEWEYVARGGRETRYSFGDDPDGAHLPLYAWFSNNSGGQTHKVASLAPTETLLEGKIYDIHGNVAELVSDFYYGDAYSIQSVTDPRKDSPQNQFRIHSRRGGYLDKGAKCCRAAYRGYISEESSEFLSGLRLVRTKK